MNNNQITTEDAIYWILKEKEGFNFTEKEAFKICDAYRKIIEKKTLEFNDKKLKVTISGGISCTSDETRDASTLFINADNALYKSKEAGRNTISINKNEKKDKGK